MNDLQNLARLTNARSYAITPENPTGESGGGGRAANGTGAAFAGTMGQGWKISPSVSIAAGETYTLANIDGSGAIVSMWFGGVVCRDYILRIVFDDAPQAQVEAPLPDFFACGWMESTAGHWTEGPLWKLTSLPVAVLPNRGMNCFWYMPFHRHCRVTLENRSCEAMLCYDQINFCRGQMEAEQGYFHASYQASVPVAAGQIHEVLPCVEGRGQYVGTALSVGLNRDSRWWGEGEMKVYLDDDEDFPTICGTGTEDYFGGSFNWEVNGAYTTYSAPYMGMHFYQPPDGLYSIQPRFSMYRWHIADPICFAKRLRVTLQDVGWRNEQAYLQRQDDFFSVAYWYQE
ncbi:MAG: glycoside hydrolase family 172 protein [Clostridia bacterium]